MVEEAVPVPMVAPTGLESTTLKLSSGSTVVSPLTLSVTVLLVSPAAKLTVPDGSVPLEETIASFEEILSGALDNLPEQAFHLVGNVEGVKAKAKKLMEG